jgi:hypothetical protein
MDGEVLARREPVEDEDGSQLSIEASVKDLVPRFAVVVGRMMDEMPEEPENEQGAGASGSSHDACRIVPEEAADSRAQCRYRGSWVLGRNSGIDRRCPSWAGALLSDAERPLG